MTRLTRRDFLKLCGASSFGLTLGSCSVAPTPTPTAVSTNTPVPTSTSSPTPTPTATPTFTLTPKPTATATPAITKGTQIFFRSLGDPLPNIPFSPEAVKAGWEKLTIRGTSIDYLPDPTDASRKVMRVNVIGPPEFNPAGYSPPNTYWLVGFLGWKNETNVPIRAIECKVYIPEWKQGFGIISTHSNDGQYVTGMEMATPSRTLITLVRVPGPDGKPVDTRFRTRYVIPAYEWVTLRLEFDGSTVKYIADGKIINTEPYFSDIRDGHAGFITNGATLDDKNFSGIGNYLYNKDFSVERR